MVRSPVTSFALLGTDGLPYALAEQIGWPVLIVFFKTTCPTCMLAFPYVERLYQTYGPSGLRVWGISQDPLDESLAFAVDYGATFPILLDTTWEASLAYGVEIVPSFFCIDAEGRVAFESVSFRKDDLNTISRLAAEAVGQQPLVVAPADDGSPRFRPG